MGLFEQFPYTNFDRLNLDMLIKYVRTLDSKVDTYLSYATITYADPILWNITSQYVKNTVVTTNDGSAYLSTQPVPAGIAITDTNYWTPIGNFSELWNGLKASITSIDLGNSSTATVYIPEGSLFFKENKLFKALTNIAAGSLIVTGSNAEEMTIEAFIDEEIQSKSARYEESTERVYFGGSTAASAGSPVAELVVGDVVHPIDFARYADKRITFGKPGSSPESAGNVTSFAIGEQIYSIPAVYQLFNANSLIFTVGPGGNYATINEALDIANNMQGTKVILIEPGEYHEQINLLPANDIVLFGLGTVTVIGDGIYPYGCLYVMGKFKAYNINFEVRDSGTGYAYHYEDGNLSVNGAQYFYNCGFLAADASAVGIGLGNNVIQFVNCRMTSLNANKSGLYAHNAAAGSGKIGYLILEGCRVDGRIRLDDLSDEYSNNNILELQAFNTHGTTIFEFYDYTQTLPYIPDNKNTKIARNSTGNNMPAMNYRTRNEKANTINIILNNHTSGQFITFYYPEANRYDWTILSSNPGGLIWEQNNAQQGSVSGSISGASGFIAITMVGTPHN